MTDDIQSLCVSTSHDGLRLDRFLVVALPGATRSAIRQLLSEGAVCVEGRRRKKGATVRAGETIEVTGYARPDAWSPKPAPELEIPVLYKDLDLIAVDKPAGLACHPLRPDESGTVASAMIARFPELCRVGGARREAGLMHRLDTTTSGVLIFARRRRVYRDLVAQLREGGDARKTYDALVEGDASGLGTIDLSLVSKGRRVVTVASDELSKLRRARPARTEVTCREMMGEFSLLEVRIGAGHRHQIRAHLAAVGHPIAGDELYGAARAAPLRRPFLHARQVQLRGPSTGKRLVITSPLAAELAECLGQIRTAGG